MGTATMGTARTTTAKPMATTATTADNHWLAYWIGKNIVY
jgi:hypothetical protein